MFSALFTVISCVVSLWLARKIQVAYLSPLSLVPNAHFSAPFSRVWLLTNKYRGCENRARSDTHSMLGPVVRIGPTELSVNCIEDGVRTVYGNEFDKDSWYTTAFRWDGKPYMFTMLSRKAHGERKRMLANLYSKSYIQSSEELKEICKVILLGRMRPQVHAWAREQTTINVLEKNKACLMDLTTAWLYGLGNGTDFLTDCTAAEQIFGAFKQRSAGFFWRSEFNRITKLGQWIGIHLVPQAAHSSRHIIEEWNSAMCKMAYSCGIQQSCARDNASSTKTHSLVCTQLHQSLEQSHIPSDELEASLSRELLDHLTASHDASGIALTYLMYELSQRPRLQHRLREELRYSTKSDLMPFPQRDIDTLPLLDALVMETLRLYSPNPGPWPRRVPASGCRIGPFAKIPAGTVVSASSYTLHRNPKIFAQPEEWQPERWLEAGAEERSEMMRWSWAFGSGARTCIGRYFGRLGIKNMVVTIYADFETSIVDDGGMEQVDAVLAGPVGDRLLLKFNEVGDSLWT